MPNFTKKAIKESTLKLLNERPLSQITVKDIVEDCGINRNSFYYHFEDIPSLIEEMITEDADRIVSEFPSIDSIEECFEVAVDFALKNKRAAFHIYNSVSRGAYEQYLIRVCNHVVEAYINNAFALDKICEYDRNIIVRFYRCECIGQIIEWMNSGMKDDIREPFRRLCELRKGMTEEMLERCNPS